ncbi:hypothetical protein [Streptomyces sp. NBC_01497]|uniref:hypothetical protein n=1 Tax=Streptomyces sp. NBC_01497 TaxID=2903885 RepID=UPI002E3496C2|nr:hypothetical protein [Streptomyces sp. NBC_01497]
MMEGELRIEGERLPSRVPSVHFTISIQGIWKPTSDGPSPQHHAPAALARHHLREQAARTLRRRTVLERAAAQDAVNAVIARPLSPEPWLVVHGTAHLTVADTDQALADEHLRHEQRGDLEREDTARRIAFLQAILSDADQRTVWWVDQYPDRLGDLDEIPKAIKNLNPPRDFTHDGVRDEVARFIDQLLTDIRTPQQREVFLRALTQTLRALGSTELQRTATQWLSTVSPDTGGATP